MFTVLFTTTSPPNTALPDQSLCNVVIRILDAEPVIVYNPRLAPVQPAAAAVLLGKGPGLPGNVAAGCRGQAQEIESFPGDIFWCERRESLVTYILTVIDATSVLKYYTSPHFINYQLKY